MGYNSPMYSSHVAHYEAIRCLTSFLWKTVGRLERYRFKVMGLTCDGLAANRQLFQLHAPRQATDAVYKVKNPFAIDGRDFFLFL